MDFSARCLLDGNQTLEPRAIIARDVDPILLGMANTTLPYAL